MRPGAIPGGGGVRPFMQMYVFRPFCLGLGLPFIALPTCALPVCPCLR